MLITFANFPSPESLQLARAAGEGEQGAWGTLLPFPTGPLCEFPLAPQVCVPLSGVTLVSSSWSLGASSSVAWVPREQLGGVQD